MSYLDRLDKDLGMIVIAIARGTLREELARIVLEVHRDGILTGQKNRSPKRAKNCTCPFDPKCKAHGK